MKSLALIVFAFGCFMRVSFGEDCSKEYNATRVWNALRSPNFPSKFPAETKCSWRLVAYGTYRVKLQFTQFALVEPQVVGLCTYQWLIISDGIGANARHHYQCGRRSPGTVVSRGQLLLLTLHSSAAASKHKYEGFEASYSVTKESPIFPVDTNKPKPTGPVKPKEDSVKPPPTPRDTLGAALDRLRPKKPSSQFAGKSQNELIEEFNRRRNQGLDAPENPDFRPNGEPVLLRDRNRDQPLPSTTQPSILLTVRTRRRSSLSYELEMVLIIIGILACIFLLIFVANKLHLIRRMKKHLMKHNDEATKTHIEEKRQADERKMPPKVEEVNECVDAKTEKKKHHRHHHICKKHKEKHSTKEKTKATGSTDSQGKSKDKKDPKVHQDKHKSKPITNNNTIATKLNDYETVKPSNKKSNKDSKEITRPNIRKSSSSKNRSLKKQKTKKNERYAKINAANQEFRPKSRQPKKRYSKTKHHRNANIPGSSDTSSSN